MAVLPKEQEFQVSNTSQNPSNFSSLSFSPSVSLSPSFFHRKSPISINNLKYTFLEVYSSGTVIIDMNSYHEAVNEIVGNFEDGEWISEFTFSFDAYHEADQMYYSHRLTINH